MDPNDIMQRAVLLCSRIRILSAKVIEPENAPNSAEFAKVLDRFAKELSACEEFLEFAKVLDRFAEELSACEEFFEETRITRTYNYQLLPLARLYSVFWSAVERHQLKGTSDITDPILELERRNGARIKAQRNGCQGQETCTQGQETCTQGHAFCAGCRAVACEWCLVQGWVWEGCPACSAEVHPFDGDLVCANCIRDAYQKGHMLYCSHHDKCHRCNPLSPDQPWVDDHADCSETTGAPTFVHAKLSSIWRSL